MRDVRGGALAIVVSAGWSALALAQAPAGGEFQVNTYTIKDQGYPAVCRDIGGGTVVVWESTDQDGDGRGVFAQRFDSAGAPRGEEFQVNTYTPGNQQAPAVSCDADGDFVVVWESRDQDGDSYGVFGQRYDSAGAPRGEEFQVNTYTLDRQLNASVCGSTDGDFVVVWQSDLQDGDGYGIFGRRFASSGAALGTEFQVNTHTAFAQEYGAVACDAGGASVVVWQSEEQDGDGYGIFGQRYDASGAPLGSEFQVNSESYYSQLAPAAASDPVGNFVVVWESYNYQDGDGYAVFGRRFASSGAPLGDEFQINTYTLYSQEAPSVAMDAGGNFVVAWASGQDGDGYGVFGRRFANSGAALGTEFQINTYTAGDQGTFAGIGRVLGVASDLRGGFVAVWQSTDVAAVSQDGDGAGIFAQRYAVCAGDCDGDGVVRVDELIRGLSIALGLAPATTCAALQSNLDGAVTIDELIAAVQSAVEGCAL